jgi:hypothetical protein
MVLRKLKMLHIMLTHFFIRECHLLCPELEWKRQRKLAGTCQAFGG